MPDDSPRETPTGGVDGPLEADAHRALQRAKNPLPEEEAAGVEAPLEQAASILDESDQRTAYDDPAPDTFVEHRRSEEAAEVGSDATASGS